jgi:predicted nucleic acid-binding protein
VIPVDTSVWIGHLRTSNPVLVRFLDGGRVVSHPFVIGELALGNIRQREVVLDALQSLPRAVVAADEEVLSRAKPWQVVASPTSTSICWRACG